MRLMAYAYRGSAGVGRAGAQQGELLPLALSPDQAQQGLLALLRDSAAGEPSEAAGPRLSRDDIEIKAPVPRPIRNIFCVGKNYHEHACEFAGSGFDSSAASGTIPDAPIVFSKLPQCVIPPGAPILIDSDVIATGTPAGFGIGFDPSRFLKPGDTVRIEIEGIGVLENPAEAFGESG